MRQEKKFNGIKFQRRYYCDSRISIRIKIDDDERARARDIKVEIAHIKNYITIQNILFFVVVFVAVNRLAIFLNR